MTQPEFLTVAKLGDIPVGEGRAFKFNDEMVAVFNVDGQYHAMDDMCPHMGASLAAGSLEDEIVTCPWHGWSFDVRDGAWCENRRICVDSFRVRVIGSEIQVAANPTRKDVTETPIKPGATSERSDCDHDLPGANQEPAESAEETND